MDDTEDMSEEGIRRRLEALDVMGAESIAGAAEPDRRDKWEKRPVQSAFNALGGGFLAAGRAGR